MAMILWLILALFGLALPPGHDWQPMPRGPLPLPAFPLATDYRLAC